MKSRILNSSYVIDFLDVGFNSNHIKQVIKFETDEILSHLANEELEDWEIHFIFSYNNANSILIYKKGKSFSKERYKEITIHIPIPIRTHVNWGVETSQHVYEENHLNNILKNFSALEVNYKKFENRTDYILSCMRRAIHLCFNEGFTVNGQRIMCNYPVPINV